jgi:NADH-quinone oxidoreductase subunit N
MLDLQRSAPEIFLLSAVCAILLLDLFVSDLRRWITFAAASLLALSEYGWITAITGVDERTVAWAGSYVSDPVGSLLKIVACGAVAVSFLYSHEYLLKRGILRGEYYVLGLFALLGIMVLVSANSLITIYLGVELLSLSQYAMVAFNRDSGIAAESAIKYFVLGSIASGALLFGMSMIYGVTGSLELGAVGDAVTALGPNQIGCCSGSPVPDRRVAFKFGAVPFHMWLPDVYHGAPTAVHVPRLRAIGSFALAYRLLAEGLGGLHASWRDMLIALAVLRRWPSATSSRSHRPISSACSRIRRFRTSASSCSASSPARAPATKPRFTTRSCTWSWPSAGSA